MDLADYDRKHHTNLEETTRTLYQKWQVPEGEQRLKLVIQHFSKLSPDQAYQLLNPEAYRREVEEIQTYKRWSTPLLTARIFLGLAPLIVTWLSLSLAVQEYAVYASHQKDPAKVQPLLQAWQTGLLHHPLTFFWTGVIDAVLLILFFFVTLGSLLLEHHARGQSEKFAQELKSVTDQLMEAIAREGRHEVSSDDEIERIVRYIKSAIADSYKDLANIVTEVERVVDNAKETIVKTGQTVEKMFDTQIQPIFTNLDLSIKAFHETIKDFQTGLHTLDDRIKELADAGAQTASAASAIVDSTTQMASNASDLAMNVRQQTDISTAMDRHLTQFNQTEQEMTQTFKQTQGEVVREIHNMSQQVMQSAYKLQDAVEKVDMFGKTIAPQLTQQADKAELFVNKAEQVATALQKAAQALQQANTHPGPWWWPFRSKEIRNQENPLSDQ